jgi:transcription antitermination factor NusG
MGQSTDDSGQGDSSQEKKQAQPGDIIRIDQGPLQGQYAEVASIDPTTGEMQLEVITKEEADKRNEAKSSSL